MTLNVMPFSINDTQHNTLYAIMLSVVMLNAVMLSVVMLSVVMLNVVAPRDKVSQRKVRNSY